MPTDPINMKICFMKRMGYIMVESNKPYSGKVFSLYGDGKKRQLEI